MSDILNSIPLKSICYALLLCLSTQALAMEVPVYDFPLAHYSQKVTDYLPQTSSEYRIPLLSSEYQKAQLKEFYRHQYQSNSKGLSPWSKESVTSILETLNEKELAVVEGYQSSGKDYLQRHYGENFKEHDSVWLSAIVANMNLLALNRLSFASAKRAIVTNNTLARALPETAPDFFHFSQAGEGFPFDTLQESSVWVGTPLYVVSTTKDGRWALVITPDQYFAWLKSEDFAYVTQGFINKWQKAAKLGLVAITKTEASIKNQHNDFITTSYIGSVFPYHSETSSTLSILTPSKVGNKAIISKSHIDKNSASKMPVLATRENFARFLEELKGRPYGWGGNFFFNDCSQEVKSLFTPFGLWLPRNSSKQAEAGEKLDLSNYTLNDRLRLLKEKGKPLLTIIYLNGHVMLYLGEQKTGRYKGSAMTYQNIWGMAPASRDKRYVLGQAVFFPLLKSYDEAPDAKSLADKPIFSLIFLDKLNQ